MAEKEYIKNLLETTKIKRLLKSFKILYLKKKEKEKISKGTLNEDKAREWEKNNNCINKAIVSEHTSKEHKTCKALIQ